MRRTVVAVAALACLVVAGSASARPDEGSSSSGAFIPGVTDFPGSSSLAPEASAVSDAARFGGDDKAAWIAGRSAAATAVLAGDDKATWVAGRGATTAVLAGDDKANVAEGVEYHAALAAQYSQYAYRRALPQDLDGRPIVAASIVADGFDWGDAGVGAGAALAVILLSAGALLIVLRAARPAQV